MAVSLAGSCSMLYDWSSKSDDVAPLRSDRIFAASEAAFGSSSLHLPKKVSTHDPAHPFFKLTFRYSCKDTVGRLTSPTSTARGRSCCLLRSHGARKRARLPDLPLSRLSITQWHTAHTDGTPHRFTHTQIYTARALDVTALRRHSTLLQSSSSSSSLLSMTPAFHYL